MSCISLTETGLLALCGMVIGFVISFCKTAEQSRCKNISLCWGLVDCVRQPLSGETILEMNEPSQPNNQIPAPQITQPPI